METEERKKERRKERRTSPREPQLLSQVCTDQIIKQRKQRKKCLLLVHTIPADPDNNALVSVVVAISTAFRAAARECECKQVHLHVSQSVYILYMQNEELNFAQKASADRGKK